ncbi:flagellar biosynthetic protein FliO [Thiomicrorhabdus sp. zzn3]|uniref:flagellar biosynthetic protein FliO n=1 Tax=Thiomicrorhabdus sp. zzn3 TaxID=3039775 RepID=UPI00243649CF|nr:flagellar biosynthetic protein FliO [Thiomicrorhabdus sp. zzn3]MDG6777644.1 flagellar biosynthetic protein FliO [Thiomicrorhabdus sp. zzn3]
MTVFPITVMCTCLKVRGSLQPLFAFIVTVFSSSSFAQETAKIGDSVTQPSDYFVQILFSLLLVLLIIFVAAWLLRRYGRFPGVADGNLKVLGALSVGQRERILLLQVGKEQVLVGVTSSKISTLHQLQEPVSMPQSESNNISFSQRFQEALTPKRAVNSGALQEVESAVAEQKSKG